MCGDDDDDDKYTNINIYENRLNCHLNAISEPVPSSSSLRTSECILRKKNRKTC